LVSQVVLLAVPAICVAEKGEEFVAEVFRPPQAQGIGERKNGKLKFSATP